MVLLPSHACDPPPAKRTPPPTPLVTCAVLGYNLAGAELNLPRLALSVAVRPPVWHVSLRLTRFDGRPWHIARKRHQTATVELCFAPAQAWTCGGIKVEEWLAETVSAIDRSMSVRRPVKLRVCIRTDWDV